MRNKLKTIISDNKKVIENYFFMTSLLVLNSLFYLIIYPYLIRVLGPHQYGLYVFFASITAYFIAVVEFGFELPCVKIVSQNRENYQVHSEIVSQVFSYKVFFAFISSIIILLALLLIPFFKENCAILLLSFLNVFSAVFVNTWYFQAIQKMRIITFVQLVFKLATLPIIFVFVKTPNDLLFFVSTIVIANLLASIVIFLTIFRKRPVQLTFKKLVFSRQVFKDSLPFFFTNIANVAKYKSVEVLLGSFFSMSEVAIYDLANKIHLIPATLASSLNSALFPKVINQITGPLQNKIFKFEIGIGIIVVLCVAIFGKWAVLFLGGSVMLDSYPLAVLLSITIFTSLIVGSYRNFVFIPSNHYYFVTKNQISSLVVFFIFAFLLPVLIEGVIALVLALVLASLFEIAYCYYVTRKYSLMGSKS